MTREKTLFKNTVILTVGKICTQLITFFLLPLYTSILSTEEYGIVDLLNVLVSLILPIATFKVEEAIFRNLIDVRDDEEEKKRIISTGLFTILFQIIIYIIIYVIISPLIRNDYKIFLAINVVVYTFSTVFQQIVRGLGNNIKFAIASIICAIVTIITNVLLLVGIKMGATGMLLGTMLGQIVCAIYLFIDSKIYKYIDYKFVNYELLKKMWKYSIPLIPSVLSWWVFNASDRVIVSTVLGVGQNGILSAAHKFSSVYISFFSIFNMSWTESISMHIDNKDIDEFFNNMLNTILRLFFAMGIGIIACMPFVYSIMIDEKFSDGYNQVPVMIMGSIFNVIASSISVIYIAKKNTKTVAITSVIAAIINIVTHVMLIDKIGLYAASISTLVSYMVLTLYRLYDIKKKYFKIIIKGNLIIKSILIMGVIIPLYYMKNTFLCIVALLLTIIYAYDLNKKSIHLALGVLKNKLH